MTIELGARSVRDVMSKTLVSALRTMTIADAASTMETHGIRHLPVRDDQGALVGMVSDRDIRLAAIHDPSIGRDAFIDPQAPVWQVMTPVVRTIGPDATIVDVARIMLDKRMSAVVVVEEGEPVGIVTTDDMLSVLAGG